MRALAQSRAARPIGCTQVTEILSTPGVTLVGPLPKEFELATVYTAGVCTKAALPAEARASPRSSALKQPARRAPRPASGHSAPSPRMRGEGRGEGGDRPSKAAPHPNPLPTEEWGEGNQCAPW